MDYAFFHQSQKALAYLRQSIDTVTLLQRLATLDNFGEITITQFFNDIVIFGTLHDIMEADDVLTMN